MKAINIKTFCTELAIITKFVAYDTHFTVFTTLTTGDENFISLIKLTDYNRTVKSVSTNNAKSALINHVAMTQMAACHIFTNWNIELLQLYKPEHVVAALIEKRIYPKQNNFICAFTKKLFTQFDMNASYAPSYPEMLPTPLFKVLVLVTSVTLIFFNFIP